MRVVIAVAVFVAAVSAKINTYEGYKVFRVQPSSEEDVKTLSRFSDNIHLDFWSPLRYNSKPIDVMVDPEGQLVFFQFLVNNGLSYTTLIKNVETVVQRENMRQLLAPRLREGKISFTRYNRHQEINAYLDQLAQDYSDFVSVETIGKSYEGRNMNIIKISTDPSANKPIIFIDAGIHAREWVAPAQATYIVQQLVENKDNAFLLNKVDWHILPVINPDGYEYTHTNVRLWRKTRSRGILCIGTDANRNFGFHWGQIGASPIECSEIYMGSKEFSEVESVVVRDYLLKHKKNIKLYLTLHSYGEYLLYPWGFTTALPEDVDELQAIGDSVANKIHSVKGTVYTVGNSANVLYPAAGGSDDWAKGEAGIELSYTIELPGGGSNGFDPPASAIKSIVTETWVGIVEFHRYIETKFALTLN